MRHGASRSRRACPRSWRSLLIAWSGRRWIDGALAELPELHAEALRDITGAGIGLATVVVLSLLVVAATVARRAADPVTLLARTAERVAAGDLTVAFDGSGEGEQVHRLHRALDEMIGALRRLVHAMRSASDETATMSAQITAGTEQLSATASEFARTAGELSQEASRMSHAITLTAADSDTLLRVSARLDAGARDGRRAQRLARRARAPQPSATRRQRDRGDDARGGREVERDERGIGE